MQKINDRIQDMLKSHKIKKQYLFVLFLLSLMIIASVCFGLMAPAMSMSGEMVCTKSEHLHDKSLCYEKKLLCTENEDGHAHSDECYSTERVLICVLEEDEEHTHTDECYEDEQILICEIPETQAHVHTDECYETVLVCEEEEHLHSADCYNIDAISANANNTPAIVSLDEETESTDESDISGEDDEEELLGEVTMDMQNVMQKEFAVNDDDIFNLTDKAVDFKDLITDIEHREVDDLIRAEYNKDDVNQVEYYYRNVDFTIKYEITRTQLTEKETNNRQIYCVLPNDIIIRGIRQGDVVKDGRVIGKYDIANDNTIIIVFNDDFVNEGEHIEGDIQFNADVKKLDDNNGFENVIIGNKEAKVPFSNLSINKENKEIESEEEGVVKVEYTITVSSINGSGEGNLTLTDSLINQGANADEIKIDRDSIKISKNNGSVSSEIIPNFTDDRNFTITGLEPLNSYESYTITYTASMKPDAATINLNTENTATVSNGRLTASKSSEFTKLVTFDISKSGEFDNKTGKVIWTIKIKNPSGTSLEGYTVKDQMFGDANSLKIDQNYQTIDNLNPDNLSGSVGSLDVNTNTFTFNEVYGKEYTLTYEMDAKDEWIENAKNKVDDGWNETFGVKNKAVLTPPGDDALPKESEGTVTVYPLRNDVGKGKGTVTHDNDKNAIITWNVNLGSVAGGFKDQVYIDEMTDSDNGNYHYMTVDQLSELKVYGEFEKVSEWGWAPNEWRLLTIGTDYTIIVNDTEINSNADFSQISSNLNSFKVRFNDSDNINVVSNIKLEYTAMGIVTDIPVNGKRTYKNMATFKEVSKSATHEEENKPPFYKFDTRDPSRGLTEHNLNDIKVNDNYVLKWYIEVDPALCILDNGNIILIDTLPNGTTLIEDSVFYAEQKQNKDQGFTVNGQEITFTIPQSVHNDQKFRIDYDVMISDDAVPQEIYDERIFENTIKTNDNSYSTSQGQLIKKLPLEKIDKIGPAQLDVYNGHMNYTVDINPTGDFINNKKPITFVDTISHPNVWYGKICIFTLDSLEIDIIEKDGTRVLLPATEYTLSPLAETATEAKFTLEGLPDGKHLVINYTFTAVYTEGGKNDKVIVKDWENYTDDQIGTKDSNGALVVGPHEVDWGVLISNKAELDLDSGVAEKTVSDTYFFQYCDRAHAQTESQIYKYQSGHFNIGLPNTHFALYKYNKEGEKSTVGLDLITNENGRISLSSLEEGALYEVIETIAPTGYAKSSLPYYFAYNALPDTTVLEAAKVTNSDSVQVVKKGQNINIANTKILPETGGTGTEPYIITGLAIMLGSAAIYFCCKRQRRRIK